MFKSFYIYTIPIFILLFAASCSTTKYVPEGQYLLNKNKIYADEKRFVNKDDLVPYIKQHTNREGLFGIKSRLHIYSLSGRDSTKWVNKKLRSWGEPPVLIDTDMIESSKNNMTIYMRSLGFYHVNISDSTIFKRKKAEVKYEIKAGKPYRIKNVKRISTDTAILNIVLKDTANSVLKNNRRLSYDLLDRERERLTELLKNKGYFAFNKGHITFEADTTNGTYFSDLEMNISLYEQINNNGEKKLVKHPVFRVNNIYINTKHENIASVSDSSYIQASDTIYEKGLYIIYKQKPSIKSGVLSRMNLIDKNALYNESDVKKTYNNLSNLKLFKSITINFKKSEEPNDTTKNETNIDCVILLDPSPHQFHKESFEISTNSSNLLGFSPGIQYGHKNLFGGAEALTTDFTGVIQYNFSPAAGKSNNSFEYNGSTKLSVPRFLMPLSIPFFKQYIPQTQIYTAYVYQQRPNYTRALANIRLGYVWKGSQNHTYMLNPIDFSMIKMYNIDDQFFLQMQNPYLQSSYNDHFTLGLTGSVIYSSITAEAMNSRRRRNYHYYKINGDIAGNLLNAFNWTLNTDAEGHKLIFGMPYSQYAKLDFTFVYNKPVQRKNAWVYRLMFGFGKSYGNTRIMPFEKMFYSGGANSLRGWQIRELGPGSYITDSIDLFPNQVGEMQFEANMEYRFSLFWMFEGAWFIDAGNVWNVSKQDNREGVLFKFDRFYKEIAMNTGFGLRWNLGYFVLRLDMGYKLYNPGLPSNRFIPPSEWFKSKNSGLHFGINYPF